MKEYIPSYSVVYGHIFVIIHEINGDFSRNEMIEKYFQNKSFKWLCLRNNQLCLQSFWYLGKYLIKGLLNLFLEEIYYDFDWRLEKKVIYNRLSLRVNWLLRVFSLPCLLRFLDWYWALVYYLWHLLYFYIVCICLENILNSIKRLAKIILSD